MTLEPYEVSTPDPRSPLERALHRLTLCQYAVQETHYELDSPEDPEHKADLLLATEALTIEVVDLLHTVRRMAWGKDHEEEEEEYEDE
jgi:hypothetical protein